MNKTYFIIVSLFLYNVINIYADRPPKLTFDGETNKHSIKLIWMTYGKWNSNIKGFNIKKRKMGSKKWINLNLKPILPLISPERDWANIGLNSKEAKRLESKLVTMKSKNQVKYYSHKEMIKRLKEYGQGPGDRIKLQKDYDAALAMGFGYIDHSFKNSEEWEYSLYLIDENGLESTSHVGIYKSQLVTKDDIMMKVDLEAINLNNNVTLTWSINDKLFKSMGITSFNIYRKDNINDNWIKIINHYSPNDLHESKRNFQFIDREADISGSYYYGVASVSRFRKEFIMSIAQYRIPDFSAIEFSEIKMGKNYVIDISWSVNELQKNRVDYFEIFRRESSENEFENISKNIDKGNYKFTDTQLANGNMIFDYLLKTVDTSGKTFESKIVRFNYQGRFLPPPVKNMNISMVLKKSSWIAKVVWDYDKESLNKISEFRVYYDGRQKGMFSRLAGRNINKEAFLRNIWTGGRVVMVKVIPIAKKELGGLKGDAAILKYNMPHKQAPHMNPLFCTIDYMGTGGVKLNWEYPFFDDLKGFRIYQNKKLILDEKTLTKEIRSFVFNEINFKNKPSIVYTIEPKMFLEQKIQSGSFVVNKNDMFNKIIDWPSVQKSIYINSQMKNDKRVVSVSWNKINLENHNFNYYGLQVQYQRGGHWDTHISYFDKFTGNQYDFELPKNAIKGSIAYIRLYGITNDRSRGKYIMSPFRIK